MHTRHTRAHRELVKILQGAYSGEMAAALAYRGHWRSVRGEERTAIRRIEAEEWEHRRIVGEMLDVVGTRPVRWREVVFHATGRTLGALCGLSGWFLPMYAAGVLERSNVNEYDRAARHAELAAPALVAALRGMADVEREHERYFRARIRGHRIARRLRIGREPVAAPAAEPGPAETRSPVLV